MRFLLVNKSLSAGQRCSRGGQAVSFNNETLHIYPMCSAV